MKKRRRPPQRPAFDPYGEPPNRLRPRSKHRVRKVLARIGLGLLGLIIGFGVYGWILLGKPLITDIDIIRRGDGSGTVQLDDYTLPTFNEDDVRGAWGEGGRVRVYVHPDFPIRQVDPIDSKVENILIFGVDARSPENIVCRADSIIILTVDTRNDCIKLTSIMRDTEVDIEGRTANEKINAAYALGGIGLLINTINDQFELDIQRFAMFDFWSATEMIDIVGGIQIDVQAEEIENLNQNMREMNKLFHNDTEPPYITGPGLQDMNGMQAIAWARIRKVGSDHARTGRQRHVMMTLIDKFADAGLATKIAFMDASLGHFETNLRRSDMLRIGLDAMQCVDDVREYKVPADGMYQTNPTTWNMVLDWPRQLEALHSFLYGTDGEG